MPSSEYTYEQLSEICDRLQREVSRHIKVEQDLINTRDALDRELSRFKIIQAHNDKALRAKSEKDLTKISLESIIEAFELEIAALMRTTDDPESLDVVGKFGAPAMPSRLPFDRSWLDGDESAVLHPDHPMLRAWSDLRLLDAIVCPFFDEHGRLYGLALAGRSQDFYPPVGAELRSSFSVLVQQIGAVWLNYRLNVLVREGKYKVLFHRSNDGILLCELDGRIVDMNQRALQMFGYDRDELTGMPVFELAVPEERDESRVKFARLPEDGSMRIERCCLHKNGQMFPVEVSASVFEIDGKSMVQGLMRDVTEIKRSQQQLVASERMAALGQLVAGVAHEINTPIGVIRASIGNMGKSLDATLDQLPGLIRSLPREDVDTLVALLARARQSKPTLTSREERRARRAVQEKLEAAGVPRADEVADTLVDMGIHDGLEAFTPLLDSDVPNVLDAAYDFSSLRRNSDNIKTAVERVSKVVFALRKFVHQDHTGRMEPADVADGIETVLTLYHNKLKQGVDVVKTFEALPMVLCHPDELNQVWTNLLHNALQAMDNRGRIEIDLRRQGDAVVASFTDDGPGIADDVLDRIFEPFFTTKPAGEGSGLGLDICKKIVERHHGDIEVDSRPGRTSFRVRIPIEHAGDV